MCISFCCAAQLIQDCQTVFNVRAQSEEGGDYSEGDTFFISAVAAPTTTLERLAKEIFDFHTKEALFEPKRSGAEFWTQILEEEDDIGFHFDKDYSVEVREVYLPFRFPLVSVARLCPSVGCRRPKHLLLGGAIIKCNYSY